MKKLIITGSLILLVVLIYGQVYIDPTNSGDPGQNGSIDHPFDRWTDFSIQSNTTYLQKRGTVFIPTNYGNVISIVNKTNVTIGSYGTGAKPVIYDINGNTTRMIGIEPTSRNITIDGIDLFGSGDGVGIRIDGSSNPNTQPNKYIHILNCDIHNFGTGTWSIPYETPYSNQEEDYQLVNCNIYDIQTDGVFWVEIKDILIQGCYIHDVAQLVGEGGDGIHIVEGCPNYLIKDNIIDRRGSVDKFCFIHGASVTWDGTTGRITGNTFYSPDDDPNWGGAAVYLAADDAVVVDHNKFIEGGQNAIYTQWEMNITVAYNLFYNIPGGGLLYVDGDLKIHNNTIVSNTTGNFSLFNIGGDGTCQLWNNIIAANNP